MRKQIYYIILFLTANTIASRAFSQADSISRKLNYSIGYSHNRTLDQQNSPLVYKANLLEVRFGFAKSNANKSIWNSDLKIQGGFAKPKNIGERTVYNNFYDINSEYKSYINHINHIEFQVSLSTTYLRKIPYSNTKYEFYAGAGINEYFYLNYLSTWGLDMPSVLNSFSFNPEFYMTYRLNDNLKAHIDFSFPLFGLITRLPYSNVPSIDTYNPFIAIFESGSRFTAIHQYQKVDFTIGIEKTLNQKWNGTIRYNFMWLHYPKESAINSYRNNIEITFSRKLKNKK